MRPKSPPSFVDVLWSQLQQAFSPVAEKRFARFIRQRGADKWIIATDFCTGDSTRPNDSFAFVIIPAGDRFTEIQEDLKRIPPRDLKDVKRIPKSVVRLLRKGRVFSICFVADRLRKLFPDAETARRSIDDTITMMKNWENASEADELIQQFIRMRTEAEKKTVNLKLLENIILTAALTAFIASLITKHGPAKLIGWVPDRDNITEAYDRIAPTMFSTNFSALCERQSIPTPNLGIFTQTKDDLWCDQYIRLADYVAGAAAAGWDDPHGRVSPKIGYLLKEVFADNRYLFVFPITFARIDGLFQCVVYYAHIGGRPSGPHQQGKRNLQKLKPIRGRSREKLPDGSAT